MKAGLSGGFGYYKIWQPPKLMGAVGKMPLPLEFQYTETDYKMTLRIRDYKLYNVLEAKYYNKTGCSHL